MLDWCDAMDIQWKDTLELILLVGPFTQYGKMGKYGDPSERVTLYKSTRVVNTYGHCVLEIQVPSNIQSRR